MAARARGDQRSSDEDIEGGWKYQYAAPEDSSALFEVSNLLTAAELPPWYEPRKFVDKVSEIQAELRSLTVALCI